MILKTLFVISCTGSSYFAPMALGPGQYFGTASPKISTGTRNLCPWFHKSTVAVLIRPEVAII